jgi:hypothetical protein
MNIYNDCPLDARDFTDYRPSSDIHNELISAYKLKNNHEFNNFIRNKGIYYFTNKKEQIEKLYGCGPYDNTMLDEKYTQVCDKNKCELKKNKNNGIGTGRNMQFSDNNISGNSVDNNIVGK